MAYVPGSQHDLFLSYAHEDAAWVSALQEQLTERLLHRLRCECDIWQDENKLRTGHNWPNELDKAIRASTAFIAVLSRNYQGSRWCEKELDSFVEEAEKKDGLETGGYGRVLKVIKFPWLGNAHEGFLTKYQHVPFFNRDPKTGQESELKRWRRASPGASLGRLQFTALPRLGESRRRGLHSLASRRRSHPFRVMMTFYAWR
jgi:hypothetical protein